MIVKIEDIQAWLAQKALWDSQNIESIEFTLNGEPYKPQMFWTDTDADGNPTDPITADNFKFMGCCTHSIFEMIVGDLK
jgi:hypothetical protein